MKILLVITKAEVGGAQMSVLNLARELKARGHEITVGFGGGDFLPAELDREQIAYVCFGSLKRTSNPFANLLFILELKKFLAGKNFQAVHFNSSNALFGAIGAKLADRKIRTVFTFRGMSVLDEHYKRGFVPKFVYFLFFKLFCLFIDRPVFVSRENFVKFGQGKITKKGILIYNGLDSRKQEFLSREEAKGDLVQTIKIDLSNKYLIGSIGRLEYAKNYEFLIKIFSEILKIKPEAIAVLIGGGPEEKKYRGLIKTLGLEDKFFLLGSIPGASRLIKAFDLFVLPSRYEGLSITLIEALFAGARILTTRVGGNPETVGADEELYELDNQADFLAKFQTLQNFETQIKVDANNQKQAQNFFLSKTVDGYEKVYKD
jgi:glycosyltransferase involved in cell wall biosynthesis